MRTNAIDCWEAELSEVLAFNGGEIGAGALILRARHC